MKSILTIILFSLTIQMSFGQACGVYELKYIGSIECDSITKFKLKLPTTFYFHGVGRKNDTRSFPEFELQAAEIDILARSHLASAGVTWEQLVQLYKENRKFIPIIVIAYDSEGLPEKYTIKLPMEKIKFGGSNNQGELTRIVIDLGKLEFKCLDQKLK